MSLTLQLSALPAAKVRGIYGPNKDQMPERMRFLHPEAAASYLSRMSGIVTVSDMFRSPESSLQAVREGRGAKMPGYSAHNFGLAIDVDVKATMRQIGLKTKVELDAWFEGFGWYCHRRDHKAEIEAWHYNYLGQGVVIGGGAQTTAPYIEGKIVRLYGQQFRLTAFEMQAALAALLLYSGGIDGQFGPRSKEALRAFQRTWGLPDTGRSDERSVRTLAYCTCSKTLT